MKLKVADENADARQLLPPSEPDGSGIGVNYADAYLKPLNVELENGEKLTCKRKGLKIMFTLGDRKGEALMCKRTQGPDPEKILREALVEAAQEAGVSFSVDEGAIYVETNS